jgi:hypothetical protein
METSIMQLFQARATDNRLVDTKYGPKRVIEATTSQGQQVTLWRPATCPQAQSVGIDSTIQVAIDSKGKASLVDGPGVRPMGFAVEAPFQAEQQLRHQMRQVQAAPQPETSRSAEISDYIQRLGKLYNGCLTTAQGLPAAENLAPAEVKDVATTIFIQTVKHFSL